FFFSSRRRHTRSLRDWSSDVCSSDLMSRNHGRALVCIALDPGVRLRDIAAELAITERTAYGIVTDLTAAGYVVKEKDGRRNRYRSEERRVGKECRQRLGAFGVKKNVD